MYVDHSFHVSLSLILHGETLGEGSVGWPPLVFVQGGSRHILHLAFLHAIKAFVNVFNAQLRHAIRVSADRVAQYLFFGVGVFDGFLSQSRGRYLSRPRLMKGIAETLAMSGASLVDDLVEELCHSDVDLDVGGELVAEEVGKEKTGLNVALDALVEGEAWGQDASDRLASSLRFPC